jgi:hypothetical protein
MNRTGYSSQIAVNKGMPTSLLSLVDGDMNIEPSKIYGDLLQGRQRLIVNQLFRAVIVRRNR